MKRILEFLVPVNQVGFMAKTVSKSKCNICKRLLAGILSAGLNMGLGQGLLFLERTCHKCGQLGCKMHDHGSDK